MAYTGFADDGTGEIVTVLQWNLRLDGQLAASAGASGTLVRPAQLSSMERHLLRDALQVVKQFREIVRHHFKLGVF